MKKKLSILLLIAIISLTGIKSAFAVQKVDKEIGLKVVIAYDEASITDTLCLFIVSPFYGVPDNSPIPKYIVPMATDGMFHFNIPIQSNGYFQIGLLKSKERLFQVTGNSEPLLPVSYFEKGDSLNIQVQERKGANKIIFSYYKWFNYIFSGTGSNKLRLMQEVDSIQKAVGDKGLPAFKSDLGFQDPYGRSTEAGYNFLKQHKSELTKDAYEILQADLVYDRGSARFMQIQLYLNGLLGLSADYIYKLPKDSNIESFRKLYKQSIDTAFLKYGIPNAVLSKSKNYLEYIYSKSQLDCLISNGDRSPDCLFNTIISEYAGEIRDRCLIYHFLRGSSSKDLNLQFEMARKIIKTPYCLAELDNLRFKSTGSGAYNFKLRDERGNIRQWNEFKDKLVIIDFWYSGCGACSNFYHEVLSKAESSFKNDNRVIFISISIDKLKDVWLKNMSSGLYTSKSVVNLNTNGEGINSDIIKYYRVYEYPTFLIVKKGKVVNFNSADIRHNEVYFENLISSLANEKPL